MPRARWAATDQHIRRLEAELGTGLIERASARCVAAPASAAFERYARALLELADRATRLFSDPELVVGTSSNVGIYLLRPVLKSIGHAHAERYRIRQRLGTNPEVLDELTAGTVDVALIEWWDRRPGFEATPWRDEPLVVIVGPDHPWRRRARVSVAELAGETLFGGEPASGTGTLLTDTLGADAARLPATVNLGSTAAVKAAVHAGLGVALGARGRRRRRGGGRPAARAHAGRAAAAQDRVGQPSPCPGGARPGGRVQPGHAGHRSARPRPAADVTAESGQWADG